MKLAYKHVHVVYECGNYAFNSEGKIHGVYVNRKDAEVKANRLYSSEMGYICILKMPLKGMIEYDR